MLNKHLCPFCSYPLLRHIRGRQPYWFCIHCHQEVPYSISQDLPNQNGDQELPGEKGRVFLSDPRRLEAEIRRYVEAIPQNLGQPRKWNEILNTAVVELRKFIQADRVIICQFATNREVSAIVESLAPGRKTMLGTRMDHLLSYGEIQKFQQGKIQIIEDIDRLPLDRYPLKRLEQFFDVNAKLAIAIPNVIPDLSVSTPESPDDSLTQNSQVSTQNSQLWGLLIAHQCSQPRQWQELEIAVFSLMAKQVAIGIQASYPTQELPSINQHLQQIKSLNNQIQIDNRNRLEKAYSKTSNNLEFLMSYVAYFVSRGEILSSPISGSLPFHGLVYEYWGYHQDFQYFWQQIQHRRDFIHLYIEGDIYKFENFLNGSLTVGECALCNLPKPISSASIYNFPDCRLCQKDCLSKKGCDKSTVENSKKAPDITHILAVGKSPTNSDNFKEWLSINGFEVTFLLEPVYAIDRSFSHPIDLILIHAEVSETLAKTWFQQLRSHPQLQDVPIIALSANAGYGLPWLERSLSIEDYLLTPMSGEHLVAHLQELSQQSSSTYSNELYWFPF